ncbi:MAG: hypothetical protein M1154_12355 [Gammaproteobacteria bacterium]|nr:hypothetical protein [Gammaproteobacteria bacterium]
MATNSESGKMTTRKGMTLGYNGATMVERRFRQTQNASMGVAIVHFQLLSRLMTKVRKIVYR